MKNILSWLEETEILHSICQHILHQWKASNKTSKLSKILAKLILQSTEVTLIQAGSAQTRRNETLHNVRHHPKSTTEHLWPRTSHNDHDQTLSFCFDFTLNSFIIRQDQQKQFTLTVILTCWPWASLHQSITIDWHGTNTDQTSLKQRPGFYLSTDLNMAKIKLSHNKEAVRLKRRRRKNTKTLVNICVWLFLRCKPREGAGGVQNDSTGASIQPSAAWRDPYQTQSPSSFLPNHHMSQKPVRPSQFAPLIPFCLTESSLALFPRIGADWWDYESIIDAMVDSQLPYLTLRYGRHVGAVCLLNLWIKRASTVVVASCFLFLEGLRVEPPHRKQGDSSWLCRGMRVAGCEKTLSPGPFLLCRHR